MIARSILLLALAAMPAAAQTPVTLADVAASLKATTSLAATFRQTGADGKVETGTLWLARPGRVRFQYDKAPLLIVANGRTLSFVDYEVRQVSQWPVAKTPLQILLSSQPDLSGVARIAGTTADGVLVEARDPQHPEFGTLSIAFTRDAGAPGGLALKGWITSDAQGGQSRVDLTARRYNADLSKVSFAFRDPRLAANR